MKRKLVSFLVMCTLLTSTWVFPVQGADSTYLYLRPDNFKNSMGSWVIREEEPGALEGKVLRGEDDNDTSKAVPASALIEVPQDGTYYVWGRSMDHDTVPGTRNYQIAVGEKLMPRLMGTHGVRGYEWQPAGAVELKKGTCFVKVLDTSCYYARMDAICITNDPNYVPPNEESAAMAEVKKYMPDPAKTSVVDTAVPTELGIEVEDPNEGVRPTAPPVSNGSTPAVSGNALIVGIKSNYAFYEGKWVESAIKTPTNGSSIYAYELPASAVWMPNLKEPAKLKLSFYAIKDFKTENNDKAMMFEICTDGETIETFVFDSSTLQENGWVDMGTFDFKATGNEYVRINKNVAGWENCTRVSDLKFEAVSGNLAVKDSLPQKPVLPDSTRVKELTIKLGDAGCFEAGPWPSSQEKGLDGGEGKLTATKNAMMLYHPNLSKPGKVTVSVYNNPVSEFGRTPDKEATYEVLHNGTADKVAFDMTQAKGWHELGTFDFSGEGEEYVKLVRTSSQSGTITRADAVKFSAQEGTITVGNNAPKMPEDFIFQAPQDYQGDIFDPSQVEEEIKTFDENSASSAKIVSYPDEGYTEEGKWLGSGLTGYQNAKSRYSFDPDAKVTWKPGEGNRGQVKISIYKLVHPNSDPKAPVDLVTADGEKRFYLDFTSGEPGWVDLGVFTLKGDGSDCVTMTNSETLGTCRANAVKFEYSIMDVSKETGEDGRRITVFTPNEYFDSIIANASEKAYAAGQSNSVLLNVLRSEGPVVFQIPADKIAALKEKVPSNNLGFQTDKGKLEIPLRELSGQEDVRVTVAEAAADVAEAFAALAQGQVVSSILDVKAEVGTNGSYSLLLPQDQKMQLTILNTTTNDKAHTSAFALEDGALNYVDAYIDGFGALGENVSKPDYDKRVEMITPPVFGLIQLNRTAPVALVRGDAQFGDLQGHWAQNDVHEMAAKGLVKGKEEGYAPEDSITRAEFATLLVRAAAVPATQDSAGFSDTADGWYAPYINSAAKAGLFEGIPFYGTFGPDQPITREEMAVMILNATKYTGKYKDTRLDPMAQLDAFADKNEIQEWAKIPVAKATEAEIIKGIEKDGVLTFSPDENSTRAQAAVMLKRFMELSRYVGPLADEDWELVFNDEFEGDSLDWDKWISVNGAHSHIFSSRYQENVTVEDGKVKLVTKKESRGGKDWTTASIWTKQKLTYGYFEARYKYPKSKSINYNIAFWLYKDTASTNKYYQELDINEGRMPNVLQTGMWGSDEDGGNRWGSYIDFTVPNDLTEEYHTYAFEWNEDVMIWYFDGKEIRREATKRTTEPMQVYLSTALMPEITEAELQDVEGTSMDVEYVRVYQKKGQVNIE